MFYEFWEGIKTNKEQLSLIISIFSIILVFYGLWNWRKQLNGTNRIKLARNLLAKVYYIRDLIHDARLKVFYNYEEPVDKKLNKQEKFIYQMEKRIEPINIAFKDLETMFYEASVEWGFSSTKYLKELKNLYFEYVRSIETYAQYYDVQDDEKAKAYKIVFSKKDDNFSMRLENTVDSFDNWLRPKFQGFIKRILIKIKNAL